MTHFSFPQRISIVIWTLQTLTVGEDSHAVNVVGVAVVDLYTFARHLPPSDTCVVAARKELSAADHSESSDTILVT